MERYTLEEAQAVLNRRECAQWGHDYEHLMSGGGELISIVCGRCGKRWKVEEA